MMKIRVRDKINYERLEKQKQKELYQAKLQFFTNASHELKNPLTLILAPLEKLLLGETDSKKRYLLSLIKRNTMRVIKNVNEVIRYSENRLWPIETQGERNGCSFFL